MVTILMVVVGKGWHSLVQLPASIRVLSQCARIRRASCQSSSSSLPRLSVVAGNTYARKRVVQRGSNLGPAQSRTYIRVCACVYTCGVAGPCSTARTIERSRGRGKKTQRGWVSARVANAGGGNDGGVGGGVSARKWLCSGSGRWIV